MLAITVNESMHYMQWLQGNEDLTFTQRIIVYCIRLLGLHNCNNLSFSSADKAQGNSLFDDIHSFVRILSKNNSHKLITGSNYYVSVRTKNESYYA